MVRQRSQKTIKLARQNSNPRTSPEPKDFGVEPECDMQAWKIVDENTIVIDVSSSNEDSSPVRSPRNSQEFMFTDMEIARYEDIGTLNALMRLDTLASLGSEKCRRR